MHNKYFVHRLAEVNTRFIGDNTKIWQFVVVLENAKIGNNCNISCHCFIENDVKIGNNVTIKSGVYLWDGLRIGNNVFVGPNVTFINDKYPHSKQYPERFLETIIEDDVSIGAGAIIMGGVNLGKGSMIAAGSLVTKNIPEKQLWFGSPARFKRMIE